MNDKERGLNSGGENLEGDLRVSAEFPAEQTASRLENPNVTDKSAKDTESEPGTSTDYPDRQLRSGAVEGSAAAGGDCGHLGQTASKKAFVNKLMLHLNRPRADFHGSSRFISSCRKGYKNARG